jgi:two-component system, sensor histidine kinase and response regulator
VREFVATARLAIALVLAGTVALVSHDAFVFGNLAGLLVLGTAEALVLGAFWLLLGRCRSMALVVNSTLVVTIGVCLVTSVAGIFRHDGAGPAVLIAAVVLGAATMMPWGLRKQALLVCGAVPALWLTVVVRGFRDQSSAGPLAAAHMALVASLVIAWAMERQRAAVRHSTRALRESEARFRGSFDHAPVGMALVAPSGRLLRVNRSLCAMLGYNEDELVGKDFQSITHPDDLGADLDLLRRVLAGEIPFYHLEKRYLHKLGYVVWAQLGVSLVRGPAGEPLYLVGQVQDVTLLKRHQDALARSRDYYLRLFDQIPSPVWHAGADGACRYANPAWSRLTGRAVEDALGDGWTQVIHPDDRTAYLARYRDAFERREPFESEFRITGPGGVWLYVVCYAKPIWDAVGGFDGYLSAAYDVTESRHITNELRLREARFRSLIEHASDMITVIGMDGTLRYASPSVTRVLGYTQAELLGKVSFDYVHPDDLSICLEAMASVSQHEAGRAGRLVFRTRRKDGSYRFIEARAADLSTDPAVGGVVVNSRDVTERVQAENARREAKRIIDNSPTVLFRWRPEPGRPVAYVTENVTQFGYAAADLLAGEVSFAQMVHPGDIERVARELEELLARGEAHFQQEYRLRAPDGRLHWVDDRTTVKRDGHGNVVSLEGILIDITERKQAEAAQRRLARAVEAAAESIIVTDRNGTIVEVNPAFTSVTGYASEEAVGQTPRLLKSGCHDDSFYGEMWTTIRAGRRWAGRVIDRRRDGSLYHAALTIAPITEADGCVSGYVGVQRDVTQDIERERALADALRQAEAATEAKTRFLANVSHEIRTPLNGILGMTDLALATELSTEQREYLELARASGNSLLRIVNDILDVSKIESGKLDLERASFDLAQMLREIVSAHRPAAQARGTHIDMDIDPLLPTTNLIGDRGRLAQVLDNLIGNAVKFTEGGAITVSVELRNARDEEIALHFAVADTGIGIPPAVQEKIFAAFEQADGSTTRRYGGTGLGLAICTQLARMMGGRIWVESEVGSGSTFHFTLQLECDSSAGTQAPSPELPLTPGRNGAGDEQAGLRVLVAEDNPVNQKLAAHMLKKLGHRVEVVGDGSQAVARAGDVDLILMDVQMPEMDGLEATAAIRREERWTGRHLPIVAMTAHAMKGDAQRCLAAGMDAYVAKPVDRAALAAAIDEALGRARSAPPWEPRAEAPDPLPLAVGA